MKWSVLLEQMFLGWRVVYCPFNSSWYLLAICKL